VQTFFSSKARGRVLPAAKDPGWLGWPAGPSVLWHAVGVPLCIVDRGPRFSEKKNVKGRQAAQRFSTNSRFPVAVLPWCPECRPLQSSVVRNATAFRYFALFTGQQGWGRGMLGGETRFVGNGSSVSTPLIC